MNSNSKDDIVVSALKEKYFRLLPKEDYPKTKAITVQLDNIEEAIRELQKKAMAI